MRASASYLTGICLRSVLGLDVLTAAPLAVPGLPVAVADSAREAFLSGLRVAVAIGSAVSFAVGLLILRLLPRSVR